MPVPAPRCDINDKSDAMYVQLDVSSLSADPDLTTISGRPKWCPQKTTLWVDTTGATIVLVDEDGETHTIDVPSSAPVRVTRPIRSIDESASGDVNVMFEWFDPNASEEWNE